MKKSTGIVLILVTVTSLLVSGSLYVQHNLENTFELPNLNQIRQSQPLLAGMNPAKIGAMPQIEGIDSWINSGSLTTEDLKGKVVLIDFWTYSCINCLRTLPYLTTWQKKYKDQNFIIIGIHTPEFDFEKKQENVLAAVEKNNINYPVALDNDFVTWRNFNNRFWPAKYLFDQDGILRYTHFGEGKYEETELAIQKLLGLNENVTENSDLDLSEINSPETYFGYSRGERFASPETPKTITSSYSFPKSLSLNTWALSGDWKIAETYSEVTNPGARFRFRYNALAANLVLTPPKGDMALSKVLLDGKPVSPKFIGSDLQINSQGKTEVLIDQPRLYYLIQGAPGEHELEIQIDKPGVRIYAITFN